MTDGRRLWTLEGFEPLIADWITRDNPAGPVRECVLMWLFTRLEDPYRGVTRDGDLPSLWYCTIPGSRLGGRAVVCSYMISERQRTVVGKTLASLNEPI